MYLKRRERNDTLTDAYHHPERLRLAENFAISHLQNVIDEGNLRLTRPRQALLIGKELSKQLALTWLVVALFISTSAGMGAGIAENDLSLGLAVGTGLLTIIATTQGFLVWLVN